MRLIVGWDLSRNESMKLLGRQTVSSHSNARVCKGDKDCMNILLSLDIPSKRHNFDLLSSLS